MVEFYLLTFPRFPLRKKEHKSYFGKNRTHDFRTSRCAAYLLDHSGDERLRTANLSSTAAYRSPFQHYCIQQSFEALLHIIAIFSSTTEYRSPFKHDCIPQFFQALLHTAVLSSSALLHTAGLSSTAAYRGPFKQTAYRGLSSKLHAAVLSSILHTAVLSSTTAYRSLFKHCSIYCSP